MDFKKFRKDKGLTQAQAGSLIGMSHSFWGELEAGKLTDKQTTAYARVLKYIDHPEIDAPVNAGRMAQIAKHKIKTADAGEMIGSCYSTWKNLATGNNKMSVRYTRLINALLIELDQQNKTVQVNEINEAALTVVQDQPIFTMVRTETDPDNVTWFCLADICNQVDYSNPTKATELISQSALTKRKTIDTYGRVQEAIFVTESGMYQFLIRCHLPKAEAFSDWVTETVLPTIRKTGSYQVHQQQPEPAISLADFARLIGMKNAQMEQEFTAKIEQLEAKIESRLESLPAQGMSADEAAQVTLQAIAALAEKKTELHDLVISIVNAAKALPSDDPEGSYYSKYANTWRVVHRHARPVVSSKSDYTTIDQIQHAINGAQLILARLGGCTQLAIDLGAA